MNNSFKKVDYERRMVYGVVFSPDRLTSHNGYYEQEELDAMAHHYVTMQDTTRTVDVMHTKVPTEARVVESFIAREGDPDFTPGAWVVGVKIDNDQVWQMIRRGELNAFSATILTSVDEVTQDVTVLQNLHGSTETSENHTHVYFLEYDEKDKTYRGVTDEVNGHTHTIDWLGVTSTDGEIPHSHRFHAFTPKYEEEKG